MKAYSEDLRQRIVQAVEEESSQPVGAPLVGEVLLAVVDLDL